ncbi:MAG: hypothetical protein GY941_00580 [Planctomycetes bacterium]|nr:hypothetical protein [Planctomycetota bacterium]
MSDEITKYMTDLGEVTLSAEIIKRYLVSGNGEITDQELAMYLKLCKYQKLNPFLREVYIIKYGQYPATVVTGKETFLKRAIKNPKYQGHRVGISEDGKVAWAEVYCDDYKVPIKCEVDYDEYVGLKDGKPNRMWASKPNTMLKKVALVQALREAFPLDMGGLYSQEEINSVDIPLPTKEVKPPVRKTQSKSSQKKQTDTDKAGKVDQGEVITKIDRVSVETGESQKTGKQWTRYHIHSVGGTEYKTFSETIAKDARSIQGGDAEALILFKTDKFGNTIETFEIQK